MEGQLDAEKEALRIQAAAVVAQQAALTEEEARLDQRRATLEQQENQLADHLEERRRKLLQTAELAQSARAALDKERETFERQTEKTRAEIEQARRELQQGQREVLAERAKLADLAARMKKRWHRNWEAERQTMRRREEALAADRRQLERDAEKIEARRAEIDRERLRCNGETELGRRRIQAAWDVLREGQQRWKEQQAGEQAALKGRARTLDERGAALEDAERSLSDERYRWERKLAQLMREAEGLDARVHNARRKVQEQQWHLNWLEQRLRDLHALPTIPADLISVVPDPNDDTGDPESELSRDKAAELLAVGHLVLSARAAHVEEIEAQAKRRAVSVETLADELADQRLQLLEQVELLTRLHVHWQEDRALALAEVEALAARLPEKEEAVCAREQALEATEGELRRRHQELHQQRQHVEGWSARLKAREAVWESERDRLLLDLRGREQLAEKHLAATAQLRQRWSKRRKQELDQIRAERSACERQRRERPALREDLARRTAALDEERRALAEKALALEQYRQQVFVSTEDAAAAEKRSERLRKQWQTVNAGAIRAAANEHAALREELTQLEQQHAGLHKQMEELAVREAQLAQRQTAWETTQTLTDVEQARARQEMQSLQGQRDRYALALRDLHDEIERIARSLMEEPEAASPPLAA